MKPLLARLISALTANRFSQLCLLKGAWFADYLMGVGAGSNVDTSGEASVLRRLKAKDSNIPLHASEIEAPLEMVSSKIKISLSFMNGAYFICFSSLSLLHIVFF